MKVQWVFGDIESGSGRTFLVAVHDRSANSNRPHKTVDTAGYHHNYITGIWSLSPLLGVKIIGVVDRSDLFKISNLFNAGRENCNESV